MCHCPSNGQQTDLTRKSHRKDGLMKLTWKENMPRSRYTTKQNAGDEYGQLMGLLRSFCDEICKQPLKISTHFVGGQ